jgi:16S rRNA (adenine1518-N6/adenine1519-N6)-dimethyltransferase
VPPRLKKALGQHHLVDGRLCDPLIDFLRPALPAAGGRVLEIGPGGGVLTRELVRAGARVWTWELDLEWAFALRSAWRGERAPSVVVGDALAIPWHRLPAPTLAAGNLPYNVATPILQAVLRYPERVPRAGFMVQKEVADRLVAAPGGKEYGALSVLVQARAEVTMLARVKAGSFRPPPKVDGAFVGFVTTAEAAAEDPVDRDRFEETVKAAFAQRRKTLRNALGAAWGREAAVAALEAAGISPDARAETLSVDDFRRLARARNRS